MLSVWDLSSGKQPPEPRFKLSSKRSRNLIEHLARLGPVFEVSSRHQTGFALVLFKHFDLLEGKARETGRPWPNQGIPPPSIA
jgi:hypothetical protein